MNGWVWVRHEDHFSPEGRFGPEFGWAIWLKGSWETGALRLGLLARLKRVHLCSAIARLFRDNQEETRRLILIDALQLGGGLGGSWGSVDLAESLPSVQGRAVRANQSVLQLNPLR